ncbi:haloacid dehalogenase-like hydrolase [Fischerella sp. PCC 9605]|uniref:haloacid dehalogenase-like hydrolase n=1 Tax=Fischerella sp. PCC 9605 TaxID=1173024 RepID=UPI00047D3132|nr:haloacid dehalogenase-like hydrolase [Fischerella sp. PCC 9605]
MPIVSEDTASAAVRACQAAGIQVKMITGNYALTAVTIARRMGLGQTEEVLAYTGHKLAQMSD